MWSFFKLLWVKLQTGWRQKAVQYLFIYLFTKGAFFKKPNGHRVRFLFEGGGCYVFTCLRKVTKSKQSFLKLSFMHFFVAWKQVRVYTQVFVFVLRSRIKSCRIRKMLQIMEEKRNWILVTKNYVIVRWNKMFINCINNSKVNLKVNLCGAEV